ncbi:GntR family transcriptional regulator [Proteiniclasticum sp.]|uniref:GntR family transcriptional regulator n=1 Tax=Proteiniclasticum sp. TaxID=2053595 RepID=UPI002899A5FC|nr:GntR family transcriptional regulator [Proteiniclasticum sp.]
MPWNFDNSIPIYLQIMGEIQRKIFSSELLPGDKLSSIRDLAKEANVNPNTMQKALQELEALGLIQTERTSGKFVTEEETKILQLKEAYIEDKLKPFLTEMKKLGLTKSDVIDRITRCKEENT